MKRPITPQLFLLSCLAGWLNREQQRVLEYLRQENRVLREQLGPRLPRLNDDQRRRLAIRGKLIGRKLLGGWASIVTPDTILRWHRRLIAAKWTHPAHARVGRPGLMKHIAALIVRMAMENRSWGYRHIQGSLKHVGHTVAHNTVKKVLKDNGIEPAPDRSKKTTWSQFLRSHWDTLTACDFFTTEVLTVGGLQTVYTFFVLHVATRRVHIVGSTPHPDARFMMNAALDLVAFKDSFLRGKTHLIMDRDSKLTDQFVGILRGAGVKSVKIPASSPNCNPHAERFVKSIKTELLNRLVFFGIRSLNRALNSYAAHFNSERPHQGIGNTLIDPDDSLLANTGEVIRHERLGGLLSFYHRRAA